MRSLEALEEMTVKQLRTEAKKLKIVGYSDLRKHEIACLVLEREKEIEKELVACLENNNSEEESKQTKNDYIKRIKVGSIIAFKVGNKAISGKIKQIGSNFLVETKNGKTFVIQKEDILWVKTGNRWPRFVFEMLKGISSNGSETSKEVSN